MHYFDNLRVIVICDESTAGSFTQSIYEISYVKKKKIKASKLKTKNKN